MAHLTEPELTSVREQLTQEENLIVKFRLCASQTEDTSLKQKFENIADRHQKHYDALFGMLN